MWSERFEAVWSCQDWPDRITGHPDMGIDLVAHERGTNDLVAIQCKFYSPSATLSWANVSTFFGTLSGQRAHPVDRVDQYFDVFGEEYQLSFGSW